MYFESAEAHDNLVLTVVKLPFVARFVALFHWFHHVFNYSSHRSDGPPTVTTTN